LCVREGFKPPAFICIVLPLSKETERIIGAAEFAKMKQGAIFMDGSRGRVSMCLA
jgi:glyoxylate/hydroxypyruvate/2-ketogluconate reductase